MNTYRVRPLKSTDANALLDFEIRNREWFESHIDARAPSFYSVAGVTEHIESYLSGFAMGKWHPFVIEDSSATLVGRANLKNINSPAGSAEVGYRIAQHACGKGLATLALQHLIEEARARWQLSQLVAYVYAQNIGSRTVLGRCGFAPQLLSGEDEAGGESRFVRLI